MISDQPRIYSLRLVAVVFALVALGCLDGYAASAPAMEPRPTGRPNFIVIYTDDQRADALGCVNPALRTPVLDGLAARGVRFSEAFVVSALCSPSRAQLLTGRYSSQNGVSELTPNPARGEHGDGSKSRLRRGEPVVSRLLANAGYFTGLVGKWHIGDRPAECGFAFARYFEGNGAYFDVRFEDAAGQAYPTSGYVERANAAFGAEFLQAAAAEKRPFFLFYNTRVPHMDPAYTWPTAGAGEPRPLSGDYPLPATREGSLAGKPDYLASSRNRTQAESYGYPAGERLRAHQRDYFSALSDLDATLGELLSVLDELQLREQTFIVVMGDNGWFLGEHRFTSKVLAYEASIRVPLLISGPGIRPGVARQLALNIDIAPTLLTWAGLPVPAAMYGRSLAGITRDPNGAPGRSGFLYEMAPANTARNPFVRAFRTAAHKLICTYRVGDDTAVDFVELYDLATDPAETRNLARQPEARHLLQRMQSMLEREIAAVAAAR